MAESLRNMLKRHGIKQTVVFKAFGKDRMNLNRYDDMMERSVKEVMLISKATGIRFSELIGVNNRDTRSIDRFIKELAQDDKYIE